MNIPRRHIQQRVAARNLTAAICARGDGARPHDPETDRRRGDVENQRHRSGRGRLLPGANSAQRLEPCSRTRITSRRSWIAGRDAGINNRTGDDAATPQAATAKAQMLMERLKAGAPLFNEVAMDYPRILQSAAGGDVGWCLIPGVSSTPAAAARCRGEGQARDDQRRRHGGRGASPS